MHKVNLRKSMRDLLSSTKVNYNKLEFQFKKLNLNLSNLKIGYFIALKYEISPKFIYENYKKNNFFIYLALLRIKFFLKNKI